MFFDFKKKVRIKYSFVEGCEIPIPKKLTSEHGWDLFSSETVIIPARSVQHVHTGVYVELPEGYNMEVIIRPDISFSNWIGLANGIEVIHSNNKKEITALLINYGLYSYTIKKGDKILQGIVHKIPEVFFIKDEG